MSAARRVDFLLSAAEAFVHEPALLRYYTCATARSLSRFHPSVRVHPFSFYARKFSWKALDVAKVAVATHHPRVRPQPV